MRAVIIFRQPRHIVTANNDQHTLARQPGDKGREQGMIISKPDKEHICFGQMAQQPC